jgi:hypothetical protein
MADLHVAAPRAAFNGAVALNPDIIEGTAAEAGRTVDRFSVLLTALAVATVQQRRLEASAHEPMLRRAAKAAWTSVACLARRLIKAAGASAEDRAFVGFALVIANLATLRGTRQGLAFHRSLMSDPADLLCLFRHASSHRSDALMAAAFNAIDRLSQLHGFGNRPPRPEPVAAAA